MEYVLAVFTLRTDTMQFNSFLLRNRIKSTVVETPKSASASCGISVKFAYKDFAVVKRIMPASGTKSFVRFYLLNGRFGSQILTPIK